MVNNIDHDFYCEFCDDFLLLLVIIVRYIENRLLPLMSFVLQELVPILLKIVS